MARDEIDDDTFVVETETEQMAMTEEATVSKPTIAKF